MAIYEEIIVTVSQNIKGTLAPVHRNIERINNITNRVTNSTQVWNKRAKEWQTTQETVTKGAKRFQMEQLGVMFLGMGMANTFGSMTAGAVGWLGIGDMFQTSLNLIALEGLLPMSEGIYTAIDGLMKLPIETKKSIGEMMLFGQVGGIAFQTIGALVLGLSSLAQAFPAAMGPAGIAIGGLLTKMAPLFGTIPGFEFLETAIEGVGAAVGVAGVVTTIKTGAEIVSAVMSPTADLTGISALKNIVSTINPDASAEANFKLGLPFLKFTAGVVGAGLLIDSLIKFTHEGDWSTSSGIEAIMGTTALGWAIFGPWGAGIGFIISAFVVFTVDKSELDAVIDWLKTPIGAEVPFKDMQTAINKGIEDAQSNLTPTMTQFGTDVINWLKQPIRTNAQVPTNQIMPSLTSGLQDFIMRPGQNPISFSPEDTIFGMKGGTSKGEIVINNNFYGITDVSEIKRHIDTSTRHELNAMMRR